jgi:hypothetical protein
LKDQVTRAWKLAYGKAPTEKELAGALAFLKSATGAFRKQPAAPAAVAPKGAKEPSKPPTAEERALAAFCQALLSSNRFLYIE